MNDLRSEFDAYTTAAEPTMELTFDGVMTVARRKYQRRRSTAIASGVAAVAAVAIAVPTLITAPSSQGAAGGGSPDCAAETIRSQRVTCAIQREAGPQLASPLRLDPPLVYEEWPNQPNLSIRYDARVSNGSQAIGALQVGVYKAGSNSAPCDGSERCEELIGPDGQKVYREKPPEGTAGSPAVTIWTRGHLVQVSSAKDMRSEQLLTVEGMMRIATTPELFS